MKKYPSLLDLKNSKKLTSKELPRLRISGSLEAGMNDIQFNLLIKVAGEANGEASSIARGSFCWTIKKMSKK